ncbi:hypothetical protein NUW58_g9051 [Xylaria curta]|uniref:Uncharacterized protein n=1 Tax=Xylaria curta TaxID=42375 RepID=A0ACC1N152_9PEZI|nr:hypothetical protein NUW58_g9051 [Xylaria curta]
MQKPNQQSFVTDQYVKIAFGKSVREYPFISCSDSPFNEAEVLRLQRVCQDDGVPFPKRAQVDAKIDDINALRNRTWTEKEVSDKLARMQNLKKKYDSSERNRLVNKLEEAKERGDEARIAELQEQLDKLEVPKLAFRTSLLPNKKSTPPSAPSQQDRLAQLNIQRRRDNAEAVRRAQILERARVRKNEARGIRGEEVEEGTARQLGTKPKPIQDANESERNATPANGSDTSTPANGTPKTGSVVKAPLHPHLQKLQVQHHQAGKDKKGIPQIHRPLVDDDIIAVTSSSCICPYEQPIASEREEADLFTRHLETNVDALQDLVSRRDGCHFPAQISCKTTTTRKRPGSSHKQPSTVAGEANANETKKIDGLDARLARIEAKLDALQGTDSTVSVDQFFGQDVLDEGVAGKALGLGLSYTPPSADWISPRNCHDPPVPPLTEALPIAELYFQDYNSVIPLFSQQSFVSATVALTSRFDGPEYGSMRMMDDYYRPYGERPRIYAGVINVVLAMGYRIQFCRHGDAHPGFNEAKIQTCVDNAQMMLDELMTRDQDTLGIQALLGLVIIHQTRPDQTASSVLISAAMRLAHSLRLESKTVLSELSPHEARQRANIFWICYWLDKDVSLRTVTPSLQVDSDIDVDLPGSAGDDCGSVLYSPDGRSQLHLFRAKVQLAHLEGRIYDTLLSNRSRKLSHEAREQAVLQIDRLLERWKQSIPAPFQLENMSVNLVSGPLIHMTVLYQTYVMCLTMTHGLYAQNSPWLKALGGLGSGLLRFNPRGDAYMRGSASSTPAIWQKCVTASRAILNILSYQSFGGCSVWLSACAYFSAITFVLVNLIYHPADERAQSDQKLAELSMLHLQKYFDYKGLEQFKQLRHVLVQRAAGPLGWTYGSPIGGAPR